MVKFLGTRLERRKNKNRGRLEIVRDMLVVAKEKTKKTRIMYQANMSYRLMEKYLSNLLESGLLECVDDSFYVITWRGKEFLQQYNDYCEECTRIGEEIDGVRKDKLVLENMCFNDEDDATLLTRKRLLLDELQTAE